MIVARRIGIILLIIVVAILIPGGKKSLRYRIGMNLADRGNVFYSQKYDLAKAQKYFYWSLRIDPQLPYVHYQLARTYLVQSDLGKAKGEIDLELKYHPENKRAFYVRGLIDGYAKNYSEAQNDFRQFIAYAPKEWAGYMDLSWVYINDQKYQEALETDNRGLAMYPDHIWLLSNKGLALYKLGRLEEAKVILEKDQELAKNLTADDWKRAYPGNNPAGAENGVLDIRGVIAYNLALTYNNLNDAEKYLQEVSEYQSLFPLGDVRRDKIHDSI